VNSYSAYRLRKPLTSYNYKGPYHHILSTDLHCIGINNTSTRLYTANHNGNVNGKQQCTLVFSEGAIIHWRMHVFTTTAGHTCTQ